MSAFLWICSRRALRLAAWSLLTSILCLPHLVAAQSKNLAPGFAALPRGSTVVVMPTDIELFEISAGGVVEPKAEWTEAASRHFRSALEAKKKKLGVNSITLSENDADDVAEINTLHASVARAIALHHFGPGNFALPTKDGKLDWSLGEAVKQIRDKSKADYAFFSWVRDSYASGERIATMVFLALLGVGIGGGMQIGYASLVDLNTGQVVWFNRLARGSGDLRVADKAAETLDTLLANFPDTK